MCANLQNARVFKNIDFCPQVDTISFWWPLTIATMHYHWTVNTTGKYLPPYTNSSPKAMDNLGLLFDLQAIFFGKIIVCRVHMNLQADFVRVVSSFCIDNFWLYSICQYLGQPGLTNMKLHWYDPTPANIHISPCNNHHWHPWKFFYFYFDILYQLKLCSCQYSFLCWSWSVVVWSKLVSKRLVRSSRAWLAFIKF